MWPFILLAVGFGAFYLYVRNPTAISSLVSSVPGVSQVSSGISYRPAGVVTIGGSPAPSGYASGGVGAIGAKASSLAGSAAGVTGSVGALAGGSAFVGSSAALALTGVGIVAAVGGVIFSMISAQHQKAVATEAALLNNAVPHTLQTFILILQCAITGEITDASHLDALLQQAITDYYSMVSGSGSGHIEGRWPWVLTQQNDSSKQPTHCNGPCVVGHFQIEGVASTIHSAIALILSNGSGNLARYPANYAITNGHGGFTIDTVPTNAGFNGYPEIAVSW